MPSTKFLVVLISGMVGIFISVFWIIVVFVIIFRELLKSNTNKILSLTTMGGELRTIKAEPIHRSENDLIYPGSTIGKCVVYNASKIWGKGKPMELDEDDIKVINGVDPDDTFILTGIKHLKGFNFDMIKKLRRRLSKSETDMLEMATELLRLKRKHNIDVKAGVKEIVSNIKEIQPFFMPKKK